VAQLAGTTTLDVHVPLDVAVDVTADGTASVTVTQRPPSLEEKVDAEIDADPMGHEWVAQATVSIDFKTAKRAAFRGSFRVKDHDVVGDGLKIDTLEVMCHCCRRTFDAVQAMDAVEIERVTLHNDGLPEDERIEPDLNCPAKIDNSHLIGGDLTTRAKRIIHEPVGVIVEHIIDRRGKNGFSATKPR
jgi:hypothetical protein